MRIHRNSTGNRAAYDGGRDHARRVCRGERNSTLRDEGCAQQPRGLAVFTLGLGEELGAQGGGKRHSQRRNHAGDNNGCHDFLVHIGTRRKPGGCEQVSRLVDGTTQIGCHHGTQNQAENKSGCARHGGQPVLQGFENPRQRRAQQQVHDAARNE